MTTEINTRLALLELAIVGLARSSKVSDLLIEQISKMRQELAQATGVSEDELPGFQLLASLKGSASSQQDD